jgi:sigma-B regulation protein RsbU (phosphoserine phosphatase)
MSLARVTLLIEACGLALTLGVLLTGDRVAALDRGGPRADVLAVIATIAVFGVIHALAFRSLVPRLLRRTAPPAYDEHRVLIDLGHEARMARDVEQLYGLVVRRIGEALHTDSVTILPFDEATGDYVPRISTCRPGDPAAELRLPAGAFVVRRLRGLATPLPVSTGDLETWERAFAEAAPEVRDARLAECAELRRAGTRLLVQIRARDQLVGVLALGERTTHHGYSDADREMLFLAAAQLALIIENEKMLDRAVAEERLRRELALAAEVQRRLLPDRAPTVPGLELAGVCLPARGVGGDYYDFVELGGARTGVAIADVSGKGISAALVMSSVQAYLRGQTLVEGASGGLGDLVARVNRLLHRSTGVSTYVTFFYAEYDAATGHLAYVNAGHNPPIILRGGRESERLMCGGPVVGVFESIGFDEGSVELGGDAILVAFTDGVTEALDRAGEEFGEERLVAAVEAAADLGAEAIRDAVLERVAAWSAGTPQHDDLTLVIAKVRTEA